MSSKSQTKKQIMDKLKHKKNLEFELRFDSSFASWTRNAIITIGLGFTLHNYIKKDKFQIPHLEYIENILYITSIIISLQNLYNLLIKYREYINYPNYFILLIINLLLTSIAFFMLINTSNFKKLSDS